MSDDFAAALLVAPWIPPRLGVSADTSWSCNRFGEDVHSQTEVGQFRQTTSSL
jgi:hypothetical protein